MTKNKRFLLISAAICGLLIIFMAMTSSCNKKVSSYNPDFVGTWRTHILNDTLINEQVASEIVIQKRDGLFNGTCKDTCGERLCDCVSQIAGKPVVNSSRDMIRFGSSSAAYPLTIDQEPYQDASGQWIMQIQGLTYYKQ